MLAHVNIIILSVWLIAEIVPLLADSLAALDRRRNEADRDD
jgi:hypothetical protein